MWKIVIVSILCFVFSTAFAAEDIYQSAVDAGVTDQTASLLSEQTAGFSDESVGAVCSAMEGVYPEAAEKMALKVLEGLAKGVDEDRIVRAITSVRSRYMRAMDMAANAGGSEAERMNLSTALADAMTAGASESRLSDIVRTAGESAKAEESAALYRDLMRFGVKENRAYDAVKEAAKSGTAADIGRFRSELSGVTGVTGAESIADRMSGKPDSAADRSDRGMSGGGSGGGKGGKR